MTYLMAPLHSLVDDLRIKNECHEREGVTLKASVSVSMFDKFHLTFNSKPKCHVAFLRIKTNVN